MSNKQLNNNDTVQEISGRIREVINQGNARRVVLRSAEGTKIIDASMTVAVLVAGLLVIFLPGGMFFSFLALAAGILLKLRVEILRVVSEEDEVLEIKAKAKNSKARNMSEEEV